MLSHIYECISNMYTECIYIYIHSIYRYVGMHNMYLEHVYTGLHMHSRFIVAMQIDNAGDPNET